MIDAAPEIYISFDLETDGTVAGLHSILSIGAVAIDSSLAIVGEPFSANLQLDPDLTYQPGMATWWLDHPDEWRAATEKPKHPRRAMTGFARWCNQFDGKLVGVAWPASFDFPFINYYSHKWLGGNPLGYSCLDIRTLAMAVLASETYHGPRDEAIRQLGLDLDPALVAHRAVDDAISQAHIFIGLMHRLRGHDWPDDSLENLGVGAV